MTTQARLELKKMKYVEEGRGWKTVARCPVCDSRDYEHEFEKRGIPLVKCMNCELRFHTRIPADPNDIYEAADYVVYTKDTEGEFEEHFNYRRERFGRERVKLLEEHCGSLSDKKLLDVGCGNGYFLSVAKEECRRCIGSEFSTQLRELAQERAGVEVYSETLEEFPEGDFDIITAFDVIEHIPTPVPFMKAAVNLLIPGGIIILYTPNFDSFNVRIMREYSSIVDGTEHVILFNHTSLIKLGEMVGLEALHTETRGLDIHSIIDYQSCLGRDSLFLVQWVNEIQVMIDTAECGDYLRIVFRKMR